MRKREKEKEGKREGEGKNSVDMKVKGLKNCRATRGKNST